MDSLPRRVAARSPTVIVLAPTELYLSAARSRLGSRISDERRALENERACAASPSCSNGYHPTPPRHAARSVPLSLFPSTFLSRAPVAGCCFASLSVVGRVGGGDNRVSLSPPVSQPALPWSPATPAYSTPDTRPCMCKQLFLELFVFFFFFHSCDLDFIFEIWILLLCFLRVFLFGDFFFFFEFGVWRFLRREGLLCVVGV